MHMRAVILLPQNNYCSMRLLLETSTVANLEQASDLANMEIIFTAHRLSCKISIRVKLECSSA